MLGIRGSGGLFLFILTGLILSACGPKSLTIISDDKAPLASGDFHAEISRLESIGQENTDISLRKDAYLRLALLYSHHSNPSPDYLKALSKLESYISIDPEGGKRDEVRNLLVILKKIASLTMENQRLINENKKMKAVIKNLERLDIEHGKRKK
ncbi:MAG: hypothetical protein AABY44_09200 [Nitrospirota bacterium]